MSLAGLPSAFILEIRGSKSGVLPLLSGGAIMCIWRCFSSPGSLIFPIPLLDLSELLLPCAEGQREQGETVITIFSGLEISNLFYNIAVSPTLQWRSIL